METLEKYKNVIMIGVAFLLLVNLAATCSSNSNVKALTKHVKQIDTVLVKIEARPAPLTDTQVRDAVKDESAEIMYKFLIYETDLDKGKTSLSSIRSDIDRIKASK